MQHQEDKKLKPIITNVRFLRLNFRQAFPGLSAKQAKRTLGKTIEHFLRTDEPRRIELFVIKTVNKLNCDGESRIVITNQYSFKINTYNVGGWPEDGQRVMIISSVVHNVVMMNL